MPQLPTRTFERRALAQGYGAVIGVDEVGMGCLAGPVVVGAILFLPEFFNRRWPALRGLRDSKLLTASARGAYAAELKLNPYLRCALSTVSARQVDHLNVYQAARAGMRRAIGAAADGYGSPSGPLVLVDGPHTVDGCRLPQEAIVKGDRSVFAIAAASVLAKNHRDLLMVRYSRRYPGYGLEVHKGYGTKLHRQRIVELGPCPLHRMSFSLTGDR